MAREIIPYNLRDDIKEEDHVRWSEDYKGPLPIGLPGSKSFTLLKVMGASTGERPERQPARSNKAKFNYIGILDVPSLRELGKSSESKASKESLSQWLSRWAADLCMLAGTEHRSFLTQWQTQHWRKNRGSGKARSDSTRAAMRL